MIPAQQQQQQRRSIIVRATPAYLPGSSSATSNSQQAAVGSAVPNVSIMSVPVASSLQPASSTASAAASAAAASAAKRRRVGGGAGGSAASAAVQLSDKAVRLAPECGAYRELSRLEQRLDEAITARRLALQEAQRRPGQPRPRRRLRLQLSSHFGAYGPAGEPGWELRIEGRALDDAVSATSSGAGGLTSTLTMSSSTVSAATLMQSAPSGSSASLSGGGGGGDASMGASGGVGSRRRFTSYLSSVLVELDRSLYGPDQHLAEWSRADGLPDTDGFVIRRAGESPVPLTVLLTPEQRPPRYRLQPQLARLLGLHTGTQAQVAHAFWRYVGAKSLLDPQNRACLVLDAALGDLFRPEGQSAKEPVRIPAADVPRRLSQLLLPTEPLVLHYLVSAEAGVKRCVNYELELDAEDSSVGTVAPEFAMSGAALQELSATEGRIADTVDQMNSAAQQAEFFADFASDPQQFLTSALLKSSFGSSQQQQPQSRAQQLQQPDPDEERRAAFFQGGWLPEATAKYFADKIDQRREELEELLGIH